MEQKNEQKLNALLSVYNNVLNDILYFQNQGDSTDIMNVLPVVFVPILDLFDANNFIISVVCLFGPLIQCLHLQRGIQAHTFVAMLRGYAAYLEESINSIIDANEFIYNSKLVDKYIATDTVVKTKGMKVSWLMTALMHYAILGICVAFWIYYNQGAECWVYGLAEIWYIAVAAFITKLCIDFSKKERKRFQAKDYAAECAKEKICQK